MNNQDNRQDVPKIGEVNFGDLRRLNPLSREFGQDRGTPIRRYYIDQFLTDNKEFIAGKVLEVGDNTYTLKYGQPGVNGDVLSLSDGGQRDVMVGNLVTGEGVPRGQYDAIILTQVLHVLTDIGVALEHIYAALAEGGVILATLPVITQISRYDMDRWGDYWRVTDKAVQLILDRYIPGCTAKIRAYGNHLTAIASLSGLAAEELTTQELDYFDSDYQILIGIHVKK